MKTRVSYKKQKKSINRITRRKRGTKFGDGLIDTIIDKIPFELHVPKYQYCGPGTHLEKRLARGDPGINLLDTACKEHDVAYSKHKESKDRSEADKILQKAAIKRVFSKDASFGERAIALGVAAAMKIKRSLSGKGLAMKCCARRKKKNNKKQVSFASVVKNAKIAIKEQKPDDIMSAIKVAVKSIKNSRKGSKIRQPRTIKVPTIRGGILPLVPIFAGLGALGSIVGSSAGIVNAINQARKGQMELDEGRRHNRVMESIAIGKKDGKGFYLHTNKRGNGFYLKQQRKNQ